MIHRNTNFMQPNTSNGRFINIAPGAERRSIIQSNIATTMMSSNNVSNTTRSRTSSGEFNPTPGSRPSNEVTPSSSERSSPLLCEGLCEPNFYISDNQAFATQVNPQRNSNYASSSVAPNLPQSQLPYYSQQVANNLNPTESKACDDNNNNRAITSYKNQDYNNSFYDRYAEPQRMRITCDHRLIKFAKDVRNVPDSLCIGSPKTQRSNFSEEKRFQNVALQMMTVQSFQEIQAAFINELRRMRSMITSELEEFSKIEKMIVINAANIRMKVKADAQAMRALLDLREHENLREVSLHERQQLNDLSIETDKANKLHLDIANLEDSLMGNQVLNNSEDINKVTKNIEAIQSSSKKLKHEFPKLLYYKKSDDYAKHFIVNQGTLYYVEQNKNGTMIPHQVSKVGRSILGLHYTITFQRSTNPYCFGQNQLCRPWGVCCDRNGNIYVGDRSNHRISKFRVDGTFAGEVGGHKFNNPIRFNRPSGIAIDVLGRLIVADKDNHRVLILEADGSLITEIGGVGSGSNDGQFNYPWDVAVNMKGEIVVADSRNKRIQLFDNTGKFIGKFSFENIFPAKKPKTEPTPRSVCFSPSGEIYVADFHHLCIVAITSDLRNHRIINFNSPFLRLQGICCDDDGNIVISDSRSNLIKIFNPEGKLLSIVGTQGLAIGQLDRPNGVCLTTEGRIVCVDFGNNRLQIF